MNGRPEVSGMKGMLGQRAPSPRPDTLACHERAVQRVIGVMREKLDEEMSLRTMAEVAIMSPFHFNRTFHSVTGLPPGHFLSALRLERARNLLVTTQERVTDVCFDVGYNSLGTFTRRFTETFGVSPRRLRSYVTLSPPLPAVREAAPPAETSASAVSGTLTVPPDFTGSVFVGLFRSSLPCAAPVACKVLSASGCFTLTAPRGHYYLYALGIRQPIPPLGMLLFDDAPRASGGIVQLPGATAGEAVNLVLRPPLDIDPPILVTLPLLLARRRPLACAGAVRPNQAVA